MNKGIGHYTYSTSQGKKCTYYTLYPAFQTNQNLLSCQAPRSQNNLANDLKKDLISNDLYRYAYYQKQCIVGLPFNNLNNLDFDKYPAFQGDSWGTKTLNDVVCPILVESFKGIAQSYK